ncbi:MFS transporter [Haloactinomyces albus]|uniref:Putative proline/betaine transporter n=1 Tax=Haloactinomyces albus TaxID=1352928 RepID=A0AAE3ZIM6_9ACTN|nr:MFS transporter [Haloactinomyces albus]MDR7303599.1 MHS family proline/betaine transporter-like MFS transporter [Haloactinomyces albus]
MDSQQQAAVGVDPPVVKRSIVAGAIGVLVHWFDWAIYAYMSTTIATIFFPAQDPTAGLLSVFAVFAVSFAIRPIGSLIFGPLGDRIGRRKTLSIVIVTMTAATLLVGLLPGYESIGILAPILLIVARLLQGLAAGGEFGSAATFLAEFSPRKHRGFGVSWLEVGSLLGFLVASLTVFVLSTVLNSEAIAAWGWRIPFLLAAPLGVIGFYIRQKIEDTPDFQALQENDNVAETPLRDLFTGSWRQFLQMCGIEVMMHVTFYIVLVYLLTYQAQHLELSSSNAAMASTVTSLVALVLVPLFGALSDRVGRKPLLIGSGIALMAGGYPLFMLMEGGSLVSVLMSQIGLGAILALILGTHAVSIAEIFPTRVRQGGLSIGYNLTAAVFAGTVPYLMTYLIDETGNVFVPAFYLMLVGAVGLVAALTLRETVGKNLLTSQDVPKNTTAEDPASAQRT